MRYIALTIGPIYKTLQNAKKTRELWGGSYIFSYIMKKIITAFKDREFIVPYIKDESIFTDSNGVGLFHDRFIFKSQDGDIDKLAQTIDEVLKDISKNSTISYKFLKDYLQINYLEKDISDDANPILEFSPYLDTLELFYRVGNYRDNELQYFLKNRLNSSFLVKDAFGTKRKSFPSLPEIALHDLKEGSDIIEYIEFDDELSVYEKEPYKSKIKRYHKYIAIVQADGDNMGEVVKSLKTKDNFKEFEEFSKKLFEYCKSSSKLIQEFGGETIFAGGDDLLFFAPVVSNDKTVFNLCDEISEKFNELFDSYETSPKPSVSFGVSISYYKYPLYEALENARNLLFDKAKSEPKNAIAFNLIKHSGQTFGAVIHRENKEIYDNFLVFTSNIKGGSDMDNFLHSIHHKINTYQKVIKKIAHDRDRLKNFFDNYFNEDIHKEYESFFEALIDFMVAVYSDKSIKNEMRLNIIYASLRFVKFVQGDKKKEPKQ